MSTEISPETRKDFDNLLQLLVPFAEQMLRKHGEFYPFGAMVTTEGELSPCKTEEQSEMPDSNQVITSLVNALQNEVRNGKIRAAGTCHDGRITQGDKKQDVIILHLEHLTGSVYKGYIPYKKGMFGRLHLGQLSTGVGEVRIFV